MKATLYEALGVPQSASDDEIRAALRRLIRRYYTHSRDGHGNVEEALRFINYASRLLGDSQLRSRYDQELAATAEGSDGPEVDRLLARAEVQAAGGGTGSKGNDADTEPRLAPGSQPLLPPSGPPRSSPSVPRPEVKLPHTGLAQSVGYFGRNRYARALSSLAVLVFAGAIASLAVPTEDLISLARNALVTLTALLVVVAAVYGVVHALSVRRHRAAASAVQPQTDLAVINWRRENAVFVGADKPLEDASWVFQLRMAELERAQAQRTSEPRPWRRLAARLLDYGLWGGALAVIGRLLGAEAVLPPGTVEWAVHPLIAPILISATWVPIEAALGAWLGTTPGKWLFAVFLQFAISDAYAQRGERADFGRWLRRAWRVWLRGMAMGIAFLAPFAMATAAERLRRDQETSWDYDGDCLVTQGALSLPTAVTGVAGLAAAAWFFTLSWSAPLVDTLYRAERTAGAWIDQIRSGVQAPASTVVGAASELQSRIASATRLVSDAKSPVAPDRPADDRPVPAARDTAAAPKAAVGQASPPATAAAPPLAQDPTAPAVLKRERTLAAAIATGPRALRDGDFERALRACETWAELEPSKLEAWLCYGAALNGVGRHREAVSALRRASMLAPSDESIKSSIARSEEAMLQQFRGRYSTTAK